MAVCSGLLNSDAENPLQYTDHMTELTGLRFGHSDGPWELCCTSPPPDPLPIEVDPVLLQSYAGHYGIQQSPVKIQVKFEENQLWILSQDGKSWVCLHA